MVHLRPLSSLEKLFLDQEPKSPAPVTEGFQNEAISWQVAIRSDEKNASELLYPEVVSPLGEAVSVRQVRHVPVRFPVYADADSHYLSKAPGLYPDLLTEASHGIRVYGSHWECLWLCAEAEEGVPPGSYPVTLRLKSENGKVIGEHTQEVHILPGFLPPQQLKMTRWFHTDCLADYYHVEAFSPKHWEITENFVRCAVRLGVNMLLMPVHTPPLDTRVGGERTTVQLVGIARENGAYLFDMTNVRKWIHMCWRCGITGYEVAHLFTQWGAECAPKVMARVDGEYRKLFGWDTPAGSPEYTGFLREYIPALRRVFDEEGIKDVVWHISDEPSEAHLASYLRAKESVAPLLEGERIMDALSNYAFYQKGIVDHPVVASDHLTPFLEHHVPDLWIYTCCAQYKNVANQFIAMPSVRCRILGSQLYRYRIRGFLHWGFNYYSAQYSDYPLDPYASTDADGAFPAGDPFLVYPGRDGMPELSIRYMVCREAMQDLRAWEWLGMKAGRDKAEELLGDETMTEYIRDPEQLMARRREVNRRILS